MSFPASAFLLLFDICQYFQFNPSSSKIHIFVLFFSVRGYFLEETYGLILNLTSCNSTPHFTAMSCPSSNKSIFGHTEYMGCDF